MRLLAPTSGRAPSEKLTLANGIPVTIALQFSTGKRVGSRIPGAPDQILYTLTDGRVAYLPLAVGQMIEELNLQPHEPFTLCKYGPSDWEVQRAGQTPPPPAPAPRREAAAPPAKPPANTHQPMNGSGEDLPAIFARCYADAIDLTIAALESAQSKGLRILPTHEGLQAAAATLFIEMNRRRGA